MYTPRIKYWEALVKIERCIASCKTKAHIKSCEKMLKIANRHYAVDDRLDSSVSLHGWSNSHFDARDKLYKKYKQINENNG